jgi:Holliday junction resolvasome RuvABC endonuclease subunit
MSLILGLDIATVTGFAWYEPGSSLSSIKTGLIKAVGDNAEEKAASLATQLVALFKSGRPDFVAIEQPMRNIKSFRKTKTDLAGVMDEQTINPNALQLEGLVCAAVAIIAAYRIPWETISSQTWRKTFLGMGRSPGFDRAMWKRAAVERCRVLKIEVKNADAAEAVGISIAGAGCQRFRMLTQRAA